MSALSARALRKSYGRIEPDAGDITLLGVLHVAVLLGYAAVGYALAIHFARKRLSS